MYYFILAKEQADSIAEDAIKNLIGSKNIPHM